MKHISARLALTAVVALGAFASAASTAVAGSPDKTPYGPVSYYMGDNTDYWTCSGFRLAAGAAVQDHFRCTVSDQTFTGTFTESNPWPCGCAGWASDVDGQVATAYVIRVSSNGIVVGNVRY